MDRYGIDLLQIGCILFHKKGIEGKLLFIDYENQRLEIKFLEPISITGKTKVNLKPDSLGDFIFLDRNHIADPKLYQSIYIPIINQIKQCIQKNFKNSEQLFPKDVQGIIDVNREDKSSMIHTIVRENNYDIKVNYLLDYLPYVVREIDPLSWCIRNYYKNWDNDEFVKQINVIAAKELVYHYYLQNRKPDCIIRVLGRDEIKHREYKPVDLLAELIAHLFKIDYRKDILFKKRATRDLRELTGKEGRNREVQGVYFVKNTEQILGKSILLIDDVSTKGSTMSEITRALFDRGDFVIDYFVIAATQSENFSKVNRVFAEKFDLDDHFGIHYKTDKNYNLHEKPQISMF